MTGNGSPTSQKFRRVRVPSQLDAELRPTLTDSRSKPMLSRILGVDLVLDHNHSHNHMVIIIRAGLIRYKRIKRNVKSCLRLQFLTSGNTNFSLPPVTSDNVYNAHALPGSKDRGFAEKGEILRS
jgi:hypothetical protein